jgi:peptidoglycan hydrolase CwlO-like protein
MTQMLLAVSAVVLMTGVAFAENETPRIDQRQTNQEQRVDQGIASEQLNEREADRLNTQQGHINKLEEKAKSDGVMTKKERARIVAAQDRAACHLAREKHDRRGKRHR